MSYENISGKPHLCTSVWRATEIKLICILAPNFQTAVFKFKLAKSKPSFMIVFLQTSPVCQKKKNPQVSQRFNASIKFQWKERQQLSRRHDQSEYCFQKSRKRKTKANRKIRLRGEVYEVISIKSALKSLSFAQKS